MPTLDTKDTSTRTEYWRRYGAAALEAQYRLTQHPDRAKCYHEYASASTQLRQDHDCEVIHYGPGLRQHFEFFPGRTGQPLFVFIHGGYWRGLDAETFAFVGSRFLDAGIHFANIEYPLAPTASMTDIARAAYEGVAHSINHAAALGSDPQTCVVSGHSAGGHLAALLPSLHRIISGLSPLNLAGTVPISGLFELEPLRHISLNETLAMSEAEAQTLSPTSWVSDSLPPSIVAVGAAETDEFRRQGMEYAQQLRAAGVRAHPLIVPEANHFTVLRAFTDTDSSLFRASMSLLMRASIDR